VRPLLLALSLSLVGHIAAAQESRSETRPEEPVESEQRQESRAAFRQGVVALQRQQWTVARDAFLQAYKLFPHPSILLDLGISRAHVGEVVEAEQDLTRFLAEDTSATPDELQTARTTLEGVRKRVGTLRVRVAPSGATATLDGKPVALVAGDFLAMRVVRGSHTLEATASGHETWTGRVDVDGPDAKVVDLTLGTHDEAPLHTGLGASRTAAITCFAVAFATAGLASFAGIYSIDLANQYNTMGEPNYQNPSTKSTGIAFRTTADVSFILAGALVVAGVALYVTAPKKQAHVAVTPFGVSGTF
jgi:PEGA domain